MDGYTKAAIKEKVANRTPVKIVYDQFLERLTNGVAIHVLTGLFYVFWGVAIWIVFF